MVYNSLYVLMFNVLRLLGLVIEILRIVFRYLMLLKLLNTFYLQSFFSSFFQAQQDSIDRVMSSKA